MHGKLKEWNLEKWNRINIVENWNKNEISQLLKCKWNVEKFEMQMEICKEFETKLHLKFIENSIERKFLTPMKKFLH